jgi:hypothetical protein
VYLAAGGRYTTRVSPRWPLGGEDNKVKTVFSCRKCKKRIKKNQIYIYLDGGPAPPGVDKRGGISSPILCGSAD